MTSSAGKSKTGSKKPSSKKPSSKKKAPAKPLPPGHKINAKGRQVPLSEHERDFKETWSKEDCVAELKRIHRIFKEEHNSDAITRNFFRAHSRISEATWNRYFGTFNQFRRDAGIELSSHAHAIERQIAKHARHDEYRKMNEDKAGWEGAFLKPNGKRFKTALVCSDMHDLECDPFVRRMVVEAAVRVKPEKIILNGDIFDLYEFSKYTQDPREFHVIDRIKWVHEFLGDLREASPDSEIDFIEGNHEYRLLRHLSEATPALKVVLSDLHGFTVPKLLGLENYEVNYVSRSDLAGFNQSDIRSEVGKNWHFFWDSMIASHYPEDRQKGIPGFNGHHHKHLVWHNYSPVYGPYEWHQLGAGHKRSAEYCAGEKWSNGFLLTHVDTQTKRSQFEYFQMHDFVWFGGVYYDRRAEEFVSNI